MNSRLHKEFRSLLLPWSVAAVAACLLPLFLVLNGDAQHWYHDVWSFLEGCAVFSLCAGLALLAGMSFGTEYQQRTLPLLLAQPQERSRLWNEKMLVLVAAIASPLLLFGASLVAVAFLWSGWNVHVKRDAEVVQVAIIVVILILTTVCSTGFWTMVTRSTIGGLAFSGSAQFLVGLGIGLTLQKIYGELPVPDSIVTGTAVMVGLVYSVAFLWLGRRKFATLELRDVSFGDGTTSSASPAATWGWFAWLRCRRHGSLRNLVRKELRLQKTVFMIAGALLACWIITLALSFFAPIRRDYLEGIFGSLTAGYGFLLPVLAGAISLGEEKTLGLTAWHLTLPISARWQWLVKITVSAMVAVALGLLLPILLLTLTGATGRIKPFVIGADTVQLPVMLAAIGLPFLLSFWAVTLLGNTIRAVLATVIGLALLGSCATFAIWSVEQAGGMQTELLVWLTAHFQLPPEIFNRFDPPEFIYVFVFLFLPAPVVLAALAQSLIQFRRAQAQRGTLVKYSLILAALTFFIFFWVSDFGVSATRSRFALTEQIKNALNSLPLKESEFASGKGRTVTLQELEANGKLSDEAKIWLRNAAISVLPTSKARWDQFYIVNLTFPKNRFYSFPYELPDQITQQKKQ